jgi:uncharacterized membrane protein YhaH (DUF805 family)
MAAKASVALPAFRALSMWQFLVSPYGRGSRKTFWLRAALPLLSITIAVALANLRFLTLVTLLVVF